MESIDILNNWIRNKKSFSFFLPDGEVDGRPFDNQFKAVSIVGIGNEVTISIGSEIEVVVCGPFQVRDDVCNLVIFNFDKIVYIKSGEKINEFMDGEFCLTGF